MYITVRILQFGRKVKVGGFAWQVHALATPHTRHKGRGYIPILGEEVQKACNAIKYYM